MRKIILFISLALCFTANVAWAESDKLKEANDLYSQAEYKMAIKDYEEILTKEGVAPEIYYNLGNAYFKSKEIGQSILNYERALRLDPLFEDARYNLDIAQTKVVDNIVKTPTFFLFEWIQNLIKMVSSNVWLMISVSLFITCLLFVFIFVFAKIRGLRVVSFYLWISLLILSLVSLTFSGVRKQQLENHKEAIVMSGVITAKSSPDKSGTDLFQLHEGTKVEIKSTLGNWIEIELGNGSLGWIEKVHIERI
jgi:tetratricopeptide (TPR) repeat protein